MISERRFAAFDAISAVMPAGIRLLAGFVRSIAPIVNWAECYRHAALRAVLSVYVGDFKLARNADDEKKA